MISLELDTQSGNLFIEGFLVVPQVKEDFVLSDFYLKYTAEDKLKKSGNQFVMYGVSWMGKHFDLWFIVFSKEYQPPYFTIELIALDSGFIACKGDWEKRVNNEMLHDDFNNYIFWLNKKFSPAIEIVHSTYPQGEREFWQYPWGRVGAQCDDSINFTSSIYISLAMK